MTELILFYIMICFLGAPSLVWYVSLAALVGLITLLVVGYKKFYASQSWMEKQAVVNDLVTLSMLTLVTIITVIFMFQYPSLPICLGTAWCGWLLVKIAQQLKG